jgi:hypothetical protein
LTTEKLDPDNYFSFADHDPDHHKSILNYLEDSRILQILVKEDKSFAVIENCDRNFAVNLNRDQMIELINELQELLDV